jgi:hypothetical protein
MEKHFPWIKAQRVVSEMSARKLKNLAMDEPALRKVATLEKIPYFVLEATIKQKPDKTHKY